MDDMQSRMGAILNDPDMMQKIMAMAQSLQQPSQDNSPPPQQETPQEPAFAMPDIDPKMIQALSGFAGQSGIDKDQKNLLRALGPYLSDARVGKLEKAMRAAKMARMATSLLGQSGGLFGLGR